MKAQDFRLYLAKTRWQRMKVRMVLARERGCIVRAALRGQLHYFEITTYEGTRHFWGVPERGESA